MATATKANLDLATLRTVPRSVWILGFVSLLMDISSEMIHALLPVYMITVLGASTLTVGFIEGIAEATGAFVKVFSGALSDRLGRRKMLTVVGYGLAALTKPVFPLASSISWLIAARFVDRIGKGIRGAPRDALIADIAPPHLRGASFGLRQSLDTVGAVVGPGLAVLLMWLFTNNFQAVFWIATIPAAMCVALLIWGVDEPSPKRSQLEKRNKLGFSDLKRLDRSYWQIVALGAVFTLARFSEAFLILRAQASGLSVGLVPLVLVLMNIVYAAMAYPAGVLSDGGDRVRPLAMGIGFLIAADLLLALASNLAVVALGIVFWGLHMGFTQGLLASMVADRAPEDLRGSAFGVFNLVSGLALLVASVLAGALWDTVGPRGTFLGGAAFATFALLGLVAVRTQSAVPQLQTSSIKPSIGANHDKRSI
jgi:MFS family permease